MAYELADSGTYTDAQLALRRKLAQTMLEQGSDTSPIASPWQGLARMAKALIGGYQVSQLNQDAKDRDQAITNSILDLPGLGGPPSVNGPSGPAPTASAGDNTYDGDLKKFIMGKESFSASPYSDYHQTSIGYGTKALPGETSISQADAESRLDTELSKAKGLVDAFVPNASKAQKDALADLTYNTGTGWMAHGLGAAVKAGNWPLAQQLFVQYNKAGGQTQPGLVARRQALAPLLTQTTDQQPTGGATPPVQVADASGAVPSSSGMVPNAGGGLVPAQAAPASLTPPQNALSGMPMIDPQTSMQIKTLLANPRTRAIGMQLYDTAMKRLQTPDVKEIKTPDGEVYTAARNPRTGVYDIDPRTGQPMNFGGAGVAAPANPLAPGAQPQALPPQPTVPQAGGPLPTGAQPPAASNPAVSQFLNSPEQGSLYRAPPNPPGTSGMKFRDELAKKTADDLNDEADKASGAVEFLQQSQAAREAIQKNGHVIGRFAKPQEHGASSIGAALEDVILNPTELASRVLKGGRDIMSAVGDGPIHVPGIGTYDNTAAADNAARDQLDQLFTKLAQSGLKATYGSRVTNVDVAQQQKTVPTLTDTNADAAISKLNNIEDTSWRTLQRGISAGTINIQAIPRDVLIRGVMQGKLNVPGLTKEAIQAALGPNGQQQ